jgi:hypothetical protein
VNFPRMITATQERIVGLQADQENVEKNLPKEAETFRMEVGGKVYTNKKEAGLAIIGACSNLKAIQKDGEIGHYAGFTMSVHFDAFSSKFELTLKGESSHKIEVGTDGLGNITRINNVLESIPSQVTLAQERLENLHKQMENAKTEIAKPFVQAEELKQKEARLSELNILLNMDKGNECSEEEVEESAHAERVDSPMEKMSIKSKLQQMKDKVKDVSGFSGKPLHYQQEI